MRWLGRSLASFLAVALVVAVGLTAVMSRLNAPLSATDALAIAADLWVACALMVIGPVVVCAIVVRAAGGFNSAADIWRFAAIGFFALFWFARLEPAHQLVSIRPHLGRLGAIELVALGSWSVAALLWPGRAPRPLTRFAGTLGILAAACGTTALLAAMIEPRTDRNEEIAPVIARSPDSTGAGAASRRVLVVGIDGLEWRTLAWMLEHGRMPALQRLLRGGRFYQHDNERLGSSAAIWTAIYTGQPSAVHQIDDFVKWRFAGAGRPMHFLPRAGMHGLFFLDEFLKRTAPLGLWEAQPIESRDSPPPPIWSIASAAGKQVGVFAALPYSTTPERLNGFFADADDDSHMGVFYGDGRKPEDLAVSPGPDDPAELREIAHTAASLFRRERPDLGVFYTHAVDTTQHLSWDFRLEHRFFGGDPSPALDDRFDATPIRQIYDAADDALSILIEGFGNDGTVIVASDHGWRYDDYEHFHSPNGVLVISPSPRRGYGGVADVMRIAPTILALLGVPADASLADPIPPVAGARTAVNYAATIRRDFLAPLGSDDEWQRRLRSLGYISQSKARVKHPTP